MKKATMNAWLALLLAGAPILGCSGADSINIGNSQQGTQLSDYVAKWDGYAQAYTFNPDGSDRVRLTVAADGTGTLQVGNSALLSAPTDPNVGYPPGVSSLNEATEPLYEGFLYPIHAPDVQQSRIQIGINPADLWADWCALQTSVPYYETTIVNDAGVSNVVSGQSDAGTVTVLYGCAPNLPAMGQFSPTGGETNCALDEPDGGSVPIDCGKLFLCNMVGTCICNATSCAIPPLPAGTTAAKYPIELDGALDSTGATLTGTLNLGATRVTVVLQKQ